MRKRREPFEDDGRTIADMSGVSSPWGMTPDRPSAPRQGEQEDGQFVPPFTRKERFRYVLVALGAALLIALAFLVGIGLVIALLLWLWG